MLKLYLKHFVSSKTYFLQGGRRTRGMVKACQQIGVANTEQELEHYIDTNIQSQEE